MFCEQSNGKLSIDIDKNIDTFIDVPSFHFITSVAHSHLLFLCG